LVRLDAVIARDNFFYIVFKIVKSPPSLLDRRAAPSSSAVMSQTHVGYVGKAIVVCGFFYQISGKYLLSL
jgi:hypothetical protein